MKKEKINQVITLILIPLLITALWEKLLGPLFDIFINWLSAFGGEFMQAFIDLIYTYVATGRPVDTSRHLFMILASFILLELTRISSKNIKSYKNLVTRQNELTNPTENKPMIPAKKELTDSEKINDLVKHAKIYSWFGMTISICYWVMYFVFMTSVGYINNTITKLTNNIEIVAPYIEDSEYKLLKSSFYSMDSADDYQSLVTELNRIAEINGIKLKD